MNANKADVYARLAISDSATIIHARECGRRMRVMGHKNLVKACYATSAKRAALVRGYADTLIHDAMAREVSNALIVQSRQRGQDY